MLWRCWISHVFPPSASSWGRTSCGHIYIYINFFIKCNQFFTKLKKKEHRYYRILTLKYDSWLVWWPRGTLNHSCNGVPQGSVLGPHFFFLCTCILTTVISSHALKTPLCWRHRLIVSFPCSDSHISLCIVACLVDSLTWMAARHLKRNPSQAELLENPWDYPSHYMSIHETLVKLSFSTHIASHMSCSPLQH